jgi:peptide/nickel transport system permease protein
VRVEQPSLTLSQLAWQRFRQHRLALCGLLLLIGLVVYICIGTLVFSEEYANYTDTSIRLSAPSLVHPFGTDVVGRDVFARTIYGGQISFLIGVTAVTVSLIVGVLVGALSGYYGGMVDSVLMRFTEAVMTIPPLFLLILAAKFLSDTIPDFALLGRTLSGSVLVIILLIGLTSWPTLARIVRASVLSLKEQEFVLAARSIGTTNWAILFVHLLPNCLAPIIVNATLGVANAILSEAYISFLGLGVRQPTATWGNMLEGTHRYLAQAPWLWFFPGMLILLTVLAINFVGDGLRDALDPHFPVE